MRYTLTHMLRAIEHNLDLVPHKERTALEPLIGAMNAGQVTPVTGEQRHTIHRTFIVHCVTTTPV